jgi:hypothetical protein
MPKAFETWKVLDHGPIVELSENIWWVGGAVPGMSLRRCMVVVRLADGRLVIHGGIALREKERLELEAWGTPSILLVPNGGHRLDAPAYKKRYPALRVLTPEGSRKRVEEVVRVDGTYQDFPADEAVRCETLHGVKRGEGAMIVRSADGVTVVLNDAVFNMDRKKDLLGFLFTTVLGSAPGPRVSRLAKLLFVEDKAALRADLERYAAIPDLVRLVVAHEKVASGADASAALRQAATYL